MDKNKKELKVLASADIHGDIRFVNKLAEKAEREKVDLVVLCGDILGWAEINGIIKPFKEINKKVLIIPGNWDSFASADFVAKLYGIRNIHGYAVSYKNIGFFGAGGAVDSPGINKISESEIFNALKKAHDSLRGIEKKIMITHQHPSNSKSEFSGILGSKAIAKAVREFKPDILIHGHIHEAAGMEEKVGNTRIINVSKKGTIIKIKA